MALALAVFVLPSCFTIALWSDRNAFSGQVAAAPAPVRIRIDAARVLRGDDGHVLGFALQLPADANSPLVTRWPDIDFAEGAWLQVQQLAHGDAVTRFLQAARDSAAGQTALKVVLHLHQPSDAEHPVPAGEEPPDQIELVALAPTRTVQLHEVPGLRITDAELRVRSACQVTATATLMTDPEVWRLEFAEVVDPSTLRSWGPQQTSVPLKILATPLTLALDVVTSPLQIVGLTVYAFAK